MTKETLPKNEIRLQIVNLGPEEDLADEDTHYDYWAGLYECISDYGLEKYAILKDYMLEEDFRHNLSDPQRFFSPYEFAFQSTELKEPFTISILVLI